MTTPERKDEGGRRWIQEHDHDPEATEGHVLRAEFPRPEFGERGRDVLIAPHWTLWDALKAASLRNLVIALSLGVLAAVGAAVIVMQQSPVYSSTASLLIDQPTAVAKAQDEGPLRKLSQLRIKYADLAHTPTITGPAAARLGRSQLEGSVAVTVPPNSLTLLVFGRAATRTGAEQLANAVADSIAADADQEQQGLGVPPADRYRFSLVEPAVFGTTTQVRPTTKRAFGAAAAFGLVSLGLTYVILQVLTAEPRLV